MRLIRFLFGILATLRLFTTAQGTPESLSDQLLHGLQRFTASDHSVSSLQGLIQKNKGELDLPVRSRNGDSGARRACYLLSLLIPDHYTDASNQSAYRTLQTKNWSDNCDLPAACFIIPGSPIQLAVALQIINLSRSPFAVRSGGHNPNPGFASVNHKGVAIDTGELTELSLNADKTIATVGAGLRFGPLQQFLDSHGVAVVSGRNNFVGVSGLLLGGGHPIIDSLTGLASDQIHSAQVVTSDFRVVTASANEHSDLFRAIRRGGSNFGIVTKWQLKTTMPRNIWYRIATYPNTNARGIFEAFAQVQRNMESDPKAEIAMICSPIGFTVSFVYGEYATDPAVFAPLTSFTPTQELSPRTNGTVTGFINLNSPPQSPASRDSAGVTLLPDTQLHLKSYNQYLAVARANAGPKIKILLPIQTFSSQAAAIAEQSGGNVMGISARAQSWFNPIAQWTDPADESKIHAAILNLPAQIKENAKSKRLSDPFIFSNIAAREQNVLASYDRGNWRLIRDVSRRYDPSQMFQRLQNEGFLWTRSG